MNIFSQRPDVTLALWIVCRRRVFDPRRSFDKMNQYVKTANAAPIPRRSGEWESRGTSPSGAVRVGPPAA